MGDVVDAENLIAFMTTVLPPRGEKNGNPGTGKNGPVARLSFTAGLAEALKYFDAGVVNAVQEAANGNGNLSYYGFGIYVVKAAWGMDSKEKCSIYQCEPKLRDPRGSRVKTLTAGQHVRIIGCGSYDKTAAKYLIELHWITDEQRITDAFLGMNTAGRIAFPPQRSLPVQYSTCDLGYLHGVPIAADGAGWDTRPREIRDEFIP